MSIHRSADSTSRTDQRMAELVRPDPVSTADSRRKAERVTLDYATWHARLAAPGSRFEPARPASAQIVRLVPGVHGVDAAEVERRTA
jgi:hypothetical protein